MFDYTFQINTHLSYSIEEVLIKSGLFFLPTFDFIWLYSTVATTALLTFILLLLGNPSTYIQPTQTVFFENSPASNYVST